MLIGGLLVQGLEPKFKKSGTGKNLQIIGRADRLPGIRPYIRPLHAKFAPLASLLYSTAKASFSTHLPYSDASKSLLPISILVSFKLRVPFVEVSAM